MIVKKEKLQSYLNEQHLTREQFADKIGVEVAEVDKLLSGEQVGYDTASKFVHYLKANSAQHFIDWKALGIKNPLVEGYNES